MKYKIYIVWKTTEVDVEADNPNEAMIKVYDRMTDQEKMDYVNMYEVK